MAPVSTLADAVLPLIRTRSDLHRYSAANAHGRGRHEAVDILEAAIPTTDPAEIYAVIHKVLASSLKVIARADDSSGIIGDACRRLLKLHPQAAAAARTPVGKLIEWMMKFQFDEEVDYFELDPVAYAPALGQVAWPPTGSDSRRSRRGSARNPPRRIVGRRVTRTSGSPWTGTRSGWPSSITTSTRSSARTRGTGRSPPGSRTPPRHSRRSAKSTSPSTGRSGPPTSTAAIRPGRPRTTGAGSWRNTDQPKRSRPASSCSASGLRRPPRHAFTRRPGGLGQTSATRS